MNSLLNNLMTVWEAYRLQKQYVVSLTVLVHAHPMAAMQGFGEVSGNRSAWHDDRISSYR
jgi:hypothetical protein